MIVESLVVGPLQSNCYVLGCERTKEGVVIDPGDDVPDILRALERNDLVLRCVALTHAHFDHAGGASALIEETDAELVLHRDDLPLLRGMREQAAMFGFLSMDAPLQADRFVDDGDELAFGDEMLTVIHTPGHSQGGVCYRAKGRIFVGDTLFAGSIGRADLPGGDYDALIESVRTRLFVLGDDIEVYPGHGPATTIGVERRTNPFFRG